MNKKLSIFAVLLVVLSILFNSGVRVATAQESETTLSLKSAVEKALSQNSELLVLDQKINLEKKRYEKENTLIDRKKRTNTIDDLIWQKDQKEKEIATNVTKLYQEILIKQKQINFYEDNLKNLQTEYDNKKKGIELGQDIESSLLSYEINLSDAQSTSSQLKLELGTLYMDLNSIMEEDLRNQLTLQDEDINVVDLYITDLDKLIDDYIKVSHPVNKLIKERDVAILEKDKAIEDKKDTTSMKEKISYQSQIDQLDQDILQLEYEIEDEKDAAELKIRQDYNNILNKKDSIAIKKLEYEKSLKLTEVTKLKFENGLIAKIEYDKLKVSANNSLCAYLQAQLDYVISVKSFKDYVSPLKM